MKSIFSTSLLALFAIYLTDGVPGLQAVDPESVDYRELPVETLARGFENPPSEARPFVRWWWNDNLVEETEVLRELDLLKTAGIGGVEINPIAARENNTKRLPNGSRGVLRNGIVFYTPPARELGSEA